MQEIFATKNTMVRKITVFELNTNGYELSENEKYNVVVECVDNNYILKFVYESDI